MVQIFGLDIQEISNGYIVSGTIEFAIGIEGPKYFEKFDDAISYARSLIDVKVERHNEIMEMVRRSEGVD